MLQLEDHALARGQRRECRSNLPPQFPPHQIAFWIGSRAHIRELLQPAVFLARRVNRHRSVFLPDIPLPQMIETKIGYDPVDPGVEGTFETEAAEIFVGLEEGLLINVLSVRL